MHGNRINWIDQARAISIILVVMMHSTLGVEKALGAEGWMHHVVAFATPFRIPAFFLISGLLLASALRKPLSEFMDKRVYTLFYLYAVWVTIQFGLKAPGMIDDLGVGGTVQAYAMAYVQPFGTLWFIFVLPVFFLIARATRNLSPYLVLLVAFAAHIAPVHTGWLVLDETADCFFYFYLGHVFAPRLQDYADKVVDYPRLAVVGLFTWVLSHIGLMQFSTLPVIHVLFAFVGAIALITFAALLRYLPGMELLRWVGRNTIAIYLGFFLPMAVSRTILVKIDIISDPGTTAVLVTVSAIIGSVMMFFVARKLGLVNFIYRKPSLVLSKNYTGVERRNKPRFRMIAAE